MSERKTSEIKFRCTPSFKAAVQAQAEAEGISASQLLENAANNHIWAESNKKLDGTALVDNAIASLREIGAGESGAVAKLQSEFGSPDAPALSAQIPVVVDERIPEGLVAFINTNVDESGQLDVAALEKAHASVVGCNCRPWEYCTHKTNA